MKIVGWHINFSVLFECGWWNFGKQIGATFHFIVHLAFVDLLLPVARTPVCLSGQFLFPPIMLYDQSIASNEKTRETNFPFDICKYMFCFFSFSRYSSLSDSRQSGLVWLHDRIRSATQAVFSKLSIVWSVFLTAIGIEAFDVCLKHVLHFHLGVIKHTQHTHSMPNGFCIFAGTHHMPACPHTNVCIYKKKNEQQKRSKLHKTECFSFYLLRHLREHILLVRFDNRARIKKRKKEAFRCMEQKQKYIEMTIVVWWARGHKWTLLIAFIRFNLPVNQTNRPIDQPKMCTCWSVSVCTPQSLHVCNAS